MTRAGIPRSDLKLAFKAGDAIGVGKVFASDADQLSHSIILARRSATPALGRSHGKNFRLWWRSV